MRWAVILLAGCFSPTAPLGIPCASNGDCPTGQQCDPVDNVCTLPTELRRLRDDSAADFAAEGAYLDEVTVETQGFLGPAAYYTGGVRIAGIEALAVGDDTPFDEIAANPLTGTTVFRGLAMDFGGDPPIGTGLDRTDDITVIVEGEIELDAPGTWRFELSANDVAVFEIAPPGSSAYDRILTDGGGAEEVTSFEAETAGWYRFRGAVASDGGAMRFEMRYDPPNATGGLREIPLARLRARVGDVPGLLLDGFDNAQLLAPSGSTMFGESLESLTYNANPFDLPLGNASYSLRWSGQILIDVEGDYAFTIDSRDGHRMWLDGRLVADKFLTPGEFLTTTMPLRLAPGWHDLVLDTQRNSGVAPRMSITVASGPALVGEFLPADHLRPVVGRVARWVGGANTGALAIPDGGSAGKTVNLQLPAGFAPQRISAGFTVDHVALAQVGVVLSPPVGAPITLATTGSISGTGFASRIATVGVASFGAGWTFTASDVAPADTMVGELVDGLVTIVGDGGVQPFERRYRYESAVRELGDVAAFDVMSWGMRQATDTETATAQVRSCDAADACASEPWTDVPFGAIPGVEKRRFLQYAVDVTTNGDVPTAVDFVELGYSVFVPQ